MECFSSNGPSEVAMPRSYCVVLLAVASLSGCAMCANPHDCKYPGYGGIIERIDQSSGRVGAYYGPQPVFGPGQVAIAPDVSTEPPPVQPSTPAPGLETLPETPELIPPEDDLPPLPELDLDQFDKDMNRPIPMPDDLI